MDKGKRMENGADQIDVSPLLKNLPKYIIYQKQVRKTHSFIRTGQNLL